MARNKPCMIQFSLTHVHLLKYIFVFNLAEERFKDVIFDKYICGPNRRETPANSCSSQ